MFVWINRWPKNIISMNDKMFYNIYDLMILYFQGKVTVNTEKWTFYINEHNLIWNSQYNKFLELNLNKTPNEWKIRK